jgi:hypothetical protein
MILRNAVNSFIVCFDYILIHNYQFLCLRNKYLKIKCCSCDMKKSSLFSLLPIYCGQTKVIWQYPYLNMGKKYMHGPLLFTVWININKSVLSKNPLFEYLLFLETKFCYWLFIYERIGAWLTLTRVSAHSILWNKKSRLDNISIFAIFEKTNGAVSVTCCTIFNCYVLCIPFLCTCIYIFKQCF